MHTPTETSEAGKKSGLGQLSLLASPEGRLLLAGLVMAGVYLSAIGIAALWDSQGAYDWAAMTVFHLALGRAAGISYGYTAELPRCGVIVGNMIIETILLFVVFPAFVFSWKKLLNVAWLRRLTAPARRGAEAHHKTIQRLGIPGLFLFVWFPFWMTGPLVGAIIGFMLGMRMWINLVAVLSGTYLAIICWAFLLQGVHNKLEAYAPMAPFAIIGLMAIMFILGRVWEKANRGR